MQKIEKLKYNQIDFKKYDTCIKNAINTRIEALSWYLDIVSNKNWEVLVLNDYQAVLPLPMHRVKRRFFKRMVTQPLFCQQLGLFYQEIQQNEIDLFLNYLKKESIFQYHFNYKNEFVLDFYKDKIQLKNNYILDLNNDYENLLKNYKKDLKNKLKKAKKATLKIKQNIDFKQFKKLKKENSNHKIKEKSFKINELLTNQLKQKKIGNFYGAFINNELVAINFFIETDKVIVNLLSVTTNKGKKTGATAFLIDYIIQKNCNQSILLDFEGSNLKGIADFFKSFGATNQPYFALIKP